MRGNVKKFERNWISSQTLARTGICLRVRECIRACIHACVRAECGMFRKGVVLVQESKHLREGLEIVMNAANNDRACARE